MKADFPPSYWLDTATPGDNYSRLEGEIRADVCVVGGGYLGLSSALHLSESGANVVLLEAMDIGWGASGRNGGQIIPGFKHEQSHLIEKLGIERGKQLFEWSGNFVKDTLSLIDKHGLDCVSSQPGWLQPAHSHTALNHFEKRSRQWQSLGVKTCMLDKEEAASRLGTNWYVGAYYDPRGGRLHPLSYARSLADAASNMGAKIFIASAARSLKKEKDKWRVSTQQGHVLASNVIVCTNAYTHKRFLPSIAKSVVPVPTYMMATAPLPASIRERILPGGETVADLKQLTNHFRLESDGRLLFGGRGDVVENNHPGNYKLLEAKLLELFPGLSDISIDYRWGGKVAITTDGTPHLHNPEPGLWISVGCNGRGIGYCTSAGQLLSQLVNGMSVEKSPVPVTKIKTIPFHFAHTTGTRMAMWLKNRRDILERKQGIQNNNKWVSVSGL